MLFKIGWPIWYYSARMLYKYSFVAVVWWPYTWPTWTALEPNIFSSQVWFPALSRMTISKYNSCWQHRKKVKKTTTIWNTIQTMQWKLCSHLYLISLVVSCFFLVFQPAVFFLPWPRHTWVLQCFDWNGVGVLHWKKMEQMVWSPHWVFMEYLYIIVLCDVNGENPWEMNGWKPKNHVWYTVCFNFS